MFFLGSEEFARFCIVFWFLRAFKHGSLHKAIFFVDFSATQSCWPRSCQWNWAMTTCVTRESSYVQACSITVRLFLKHWCPRKQHGLCKQGLGQTKVWVLDIEIRNWVLISWFSCIPMMLSYSQWLCSSQPLEYPRAVMILFMHCKFRIIDASGIWSLTVWKGI